MPARHPHTLDAVCGYLAEVTTALGIGLEFCTVDHDSPVSVNDDRVGQLAPPSPPMTDALPRS